MPLQPVSRRSVSDAVYDQLVTEIVGGHLEAGDTLPAERSLVDVLGVNRQAVREALKRLHQAGLVEIQHGGSTRVRDYRTSAGLDLLPELLVRPDGTFDAAVVRSVMEMRACIGPDAARLCALRAVPPLAEQLVEMADEMLAADRDLARLAELDWDFWDLVIDGADNIAYRLAYNSLRHSSQPLLDALAVVLADELLDVDAHRAIATAIATDDEVGAEHAAGALLAKGSAATAATLVALTSDEAP